MEPVLKVVEYPLGLTFANLILPYSFLDHTLLKTSWTSIFILQVDRKEALFTTVALYGNCLPEMTTQTLFPVVTKKGVKTIILLNQQSGKMPSVYLLIILTYSEG